MSERVTLPFLGTCVCLSTCSRTCHVNGFVPAPENRKRWPHRPDKPKGGHRALHTHAAAEQSSTKPQWTSRENKGTPAPVRKATSVAHAYPASPHNPPQPCGKGAGSVVTCPGHTQEPKANPAVIPLCWHTNFGEDVCLPQNLPA